VSSWLRGEKNRSQSHWKKNENVGFAVKAFEQGSMAGGE